MQTPVNKSSINCQHILYLITSNRHCFKHYYTHTTSYLLQKILAGVKVSSESQHLVSHFSSAASWF